MIIIPMAGLSSRFKNAGYTKPKYMLEAHGRTLFSHSINSFQKYFDSESFLFIALDVNHTSDFIKSECLKLGIKNFNIVILDSPTKGQAQTVYEGLTIAKVALDEPLLIFNIDTFRPNFTYPDYLDMDCIDGYLETFIGEGKNWSNILPKEEKDHSVALTAEKKEISKYCCTGLYFWRYAKDFILVFNEYQQRPLSEIDAGEYYIAPMYNHIISKGADIRYSVISHKDVIFCGIPSEYEEFITTGQNI
ncbi:glycosyltransferase family 2 protein [Aeromonas salmonicida]|uniref:glycosyltransferase family 2 protein n=1 Tax=Aeromonas salmonicida TaxID=645 RepID=UPI00240E02C4|nr:glycosyltransferase family 2 protein [Aeromonas salmonicida]WFC15677.1 glycosyltransferase family 2 protein [Aeromonas salmonicida]